VLTGRDLQYTKKRGGTIVVILRAVLVLRSVNWLADWRRRQADMLGLDLACRRLEVDPCLRSGVCPVGEAVGGRTVASRAMLGD